jgi:hypothetical protein
VRLLRNAQVAAALEVERVKIQSRSRFIRGIERIGRNWGRSPILPLPIDLGPFT